jgi:ribosomal protein L19E
MQRRPWRTFGYRPETGSRSCTATGRDQLARSIAVPPRRINEIVHGQRRISADAARLAANPEYQAEIRAVREELDELRAW